MTKIVNSIMCTYQKYYYYWPLFFQSVLFCFAITIAPIPITGGDFPYYVKQFKILMTGEMDYTKIRPPPRGPLVYPAGHVYFFSWQYFLSDHGENPLPLKVIFYILHFFMLYLVIKLFKYFHEERPYVAIFLLGIGVKIQHIWL